MNGDPGRRADDLPLAGLLAIEAGHSVAAPFAGLILADLGARVIKVEQPAHRRRCAVVGSSVLESAPRGGFALSMGTGMWSVIGILAAIERRHRTSAGDVVDASLFETALAWMTVSVATTLASGRESGPTGSETAMIAPYKAYRAMDRYAVIAAGNDTLFRRLAITLGHPEWTSDARYRDNAARVVNRKSLNAAIAAVVATRPSSHWVELLGAAGVPCAPLQTVSEVLAHPQTRAIEMVCPVPGSPLSLVGHPLRFDGQRPPLRTPPPALGSGNAEIFGRRAGDA